MIPELRAGLLSAESDAPVFQQIQAMFCQLQNSIQKSYDTRPLCNVYTDYSGRPMQPHVQMDVEEFMNQLFDRIETALKETPYKSLMKDTFGGKMTQQIISKVRNLVVF